MLKTSEISMGQINRGPAKGTVCEACRKAKAVKFVGNLAGYYVAMCSDCTGQFTFCTGAAQTRGFSKPVAALVKKSNSEFVALLKRESKKVRELQRRHGRGWAKVAQSML